MRESHFGIPFLSPLAFCLAALLILTPIHTPGQTPTPEPRTLFSATLPIEARQAARGFQTAPGLQVQLWASEPLMANPVSFAFDPAGRLYLVETHRRRSSVYDIRKHRDWLDKDYSFRTVDDRIRFLQTVLSPGNDALPQNIRIDRNHDSVFDYHDLEVESERIRLIEDTDDNGQADTATVFADGFNTIVSGVAAGILVRPPDVWFTCIPDLWHLRDSDADHLAEDRKSLLHGFGVHIAFGGHDMHGLTMGPDGKLYFSIADRGFSVQTEGKTFANPDSGAVMRCNPDGTGFEVVATGLRNPQELAFDQFGNLWTGDNNGDAGDKARWVYVVEGSESGWQYGWQAQPNLGLWNSERLWELPPLNNAAYLLPPVAHIGHGPAGLAFYPGTGMPDQYRNHFFLCDFPGGVNSFAVREIGASYEMIDLQNVFSGLYPVDVDFGPDGAAYVADWIEGWEKTGKGRIWRVFNPQATEDSAARETRELLAEGMTDVSRRRLARLLENPDRRVRLEAQFELARRGDSSIETLAKVAEKGDEPLARLHAIWGLGQIGRRNLQALEPLMALFTDQDPEVRAQIARVMGDARLQDAFDPLVALLRDPSLRVRSLAAPALGKLRQPAALEPVFQMLRENGNKDPFLRHAGVMALVGINDMNALITAAKDPDASVRLASLLAMRRLTRPEAAMFLYDSEPTILLEAVRAIYDLPIESALSQVAALSGQLARLPALQDRSKLNPVFETALLRRIIHAQYRMGELENALALAEFAANPERPEALRAEALELLRDWEKPPGRDRLLGLWRPLPERPTRGPSLALRSHLPALLKTAPDSVRIAAAQCALALGIGRAAPVLFELISQTALAPQVRVEALRTLVALEDSRVRDALGIAMADPAESVRREATQWFAKLNPNDAVGKLAVTLTNGSIRDKQAALQALAQLKSPIVDRILVSWIDKLKNGSLPAELHLDLLEAARPRTSPEIQAALAPLATPPQTAGSPTAHPELLAGGDTDRGRTIFFERVEVACVRCHKTDTEGGDVGPNLKGIASRQDRSYLLESILYPNNKINENYGTEIITLKDGASFVGLTKLETDKQLVLNSPEDGLITLNKAEIADRKPGLSAMPAEMASLLSQRDLRDLVEFLANLR
jgi:quinoprotein glucose dehydrogenase